ncbi:Replication protein A C-terminal domain-containing protein [Candidatus Magnetomoraceae bacterium gMMP-15]
MTKTEKQIQSIVGSLQIVAKELENITTNIKGTTAKDTTVKDTPKKKTAKALVSKKRAAKPKKKVARPKKKVLKRKTLVKKTTQIKKRNVEQDKPFTVLESVLSVINKHKKGISIAKLKKVTGLENRQVSNALYKLSQKGLVETAERGVYVAVKE